MTQLMNDPMLANTLQAEVTQGENLFPKVGEVKLNPYRVFPGYDNIPFRLPRGQQIPAIKQDDPEHMQPRPVADAHAKVFNLSKAEDVAEYSAIWDAGAKGTVLISKEELHWSDKEQTFLAFLRWGELFLEIPKEGLDAHRTFSS